MKKDKEDKNKIDFLDLYKSVIEKRGNQQSIDYLIGYL